MEVRIAMTSIRIDAEVIFQMKSRRDPATQSLWRSYAEHFLHQNAIMRTAMAEAGARRTSPRFCTRAKMSDADPAYLAHTRSDRARLADVSDRCSQPEELAKREALRLSAYAKSG
ncbi:hypothetical protein XH94_23150 [Bradyrhizobium zhanjiangense]|uniref:Uncharacterized protein n=1 Tax=Bradyrhizobium zhanjiangense TaxID=1325107 RepID=A0A4Q0SI87_9BRAD|nr:hypothetical protein XH94_23150 [Bradyrhizobium zhanjiangense]